MLVRDPLVDVEEFATGTGWHVQPQGLCRGDVCIPIPEDSLQGHGLDLTRVADALRMPLVHDSAVGLWAMGPPAAGHVLESAQAPDLTLPTVQGAPFELRSLRGRKVLLVVWASW
jgi:hypothetical protein